MCFQIKKNKTKQNNIQDLSDIVLTFWRVKEKTRNSSVGYRLLLLSVAAQMIKSTADSSSSFYPRCSRYVYRFHRYLLVNGIFLIQKLAPLPNINLPVPYWVASFTVRLLQSCLLQQLQDCLFIFSLKNQFIILYSFCEIAAHYLLALEKFRVKQISQVEYFTLNV